MLLVTEGSTEELLFIDTRGDVIESASNHRWEKAGIRADSVYCPVWDGPGVEIGNRFRRKEYPLQRRLDEIFDDVLGLFDLCLPTSTFVLGGVQCIGWRKTSVSDF